MPRTPSVRYVVVLTLCTYFSSAQILFSNQDAYVVSETTIYEIVKKGLLSNFASIDEKIRGTLSVQNQQISSGSDANILKLNERVSNLEDEIQTLKDNMSSKRNSEIELLERKTQNCSRHLENLESRFQETKLLMEDSNILTSKQLASVSEFLNNFTSALDNLDVKIDLMQNSNQNLSQGMTNVESRMNKSLHETGLQINMSYSKMNDKIKNMSVTMEMMEIAINESEAKLQCMRKDQQKLNESMQNIELRVSTGFKNTRSQLNLSNSLTNEKLINMSAIMRISHTSLDTKIEDISKNVSVSELKMQQGVNTSLQEIRRELSNYTGHIQRTLKEALNESVWMTEKRQQSLTAKLSSALINVTKMLDNTKERFHQEGLKSNATMHKLEDNITKQTEKVFKSNLEMSSLKQNMSKRIDDTFILLNHSFIIKTIDIKDDIETVGEKCENMAKTLEIYFDEKVISSVDNLTKSLNQTNIQVELQGSKMFRSIGILNEQVQILQTEKSNLLENVAKTRNELSELRKNESMGTKNVHSRITELALNISSLANETHFDVKQLVARMNKTLHETGLQINTSYSKMNDKITNISVTMEMMETAINESEAKLECLRKDQQKINESMQNIELSRTNVESRMNKTLHETLHETGLQINKSYSKMNDKITNMSVTMEMMEIAINESEAKLECMRKDQQKLDESMQNIELRVSTGFENTRSQFNLSNSLTNEKLINMSAIMRILHTSLDTKIEDISKNVSVSELKMQQGVNTSLQEIRRELSNYTGHIQRTLKEALNESIWKTEKRQQSLTAKLSSALINVTKMLDNTKERFHQEGLKSNATMHKLEDNITKLTEKVFKSNLEMSSLKQNMSKRIDDTFILLNHSFIIETIHLKDNIETFSGKCENMTKALDIFVDEKVIASVDKLTKSLNQTNIQVELQGSKMFRSIGILNEQVQILQTEKSNLLENVAEIRNELSELKRNETMGSIYLHSWITELELNISSLANETEIDHKNLVARFSANVSGIDSRFKNISQNVSFLFDNLMLQMEFQKKSNGTLKDIQEMFQVYKRDNELRISGTIQNCLEMNRRLEQSVHEEINLSVINTTKNINMTHNRMHVQELKMNQSIGLIETQLKRMQSEKLI
ncbi:uncharacterized protein LOC144618694 [Crassostrea virginica]